MALSLSTLGSCCGHTFNLHLTNDSGPHNRCSACSCDRFEADECHRGHIPGCKHMVDPEKRCKALLRRQTLPEAVQCVEEHRANSIAFIWHRAPHPYRPGEYLAWSEQEAVYPVIDVSQLSDEEVAGFEGVANSDRTTVTEAPGEFARDNQVGGNHYKKFKIQPWDVIDEYGLTFYAGNALKYLLRAGRKGVALEDLKKARHYLDRMIEIEESK